MTSNSMSDAIRGSAAEGRERARQASGRSLSEPKPAPPPQSPSPPAAQQTAPKGVGHKAVRVRDVMTTDVTSCRPRATLASAVLAMNRADCRFLPVVDAAGRPVGVITDGDICLLGATNHRPLRDIFVHEVMTQPVSTCCLETDILEVLRIMRSQRIRHVPVVGEDGVLVGIVSLTDLVLWSEDRCGDPVCHEIAAAVREISQKYPGGRCVRLHPFIEG